MSSDLKLRLSERLVAAASKPAPGRSQPRSLIDSIRDNLSGVLMTHRGDSLSCPDYGLPDFSQQVLGFPEQEYEFRKSIMDAINKYEPRFRVDAKDIELDEIPANGAPAAKFRIVGYVVGGESTRVRPIEGEIEVSGIVRLL